METLTATQAARSFSSVLDRVKAGEEVRIERDGELVAEIIPPALSQYDELAQFFASRHADDAWLELVEQAHDAKTAQEIPSWDED